MYNELIAKLSPFGQEHLLSSWNALSPSEKDSLATQIHSLDLPLLKDLHQLAVQGISHDSQDQQIEPLPFRMVYEDPRQEYWFEAGKAALRAGQVGAFLVAGGQGSRLGYEGPKGAYNIGLPSQKSIFQYHAERLLRLKTLYGIQAPWCIMTSPLNHDATIQHFAEHSYFGLEKDRIRFFSQAMLPALDPQGKVLLESPEKIFLVPDGNGGCFRALSSSGALDWLSSLGVRYLFLTGVDNVLVKVCDPVFIGALATQNEFASASKVVRKAYPEERVGIFAMQNGKPGVIEYSDLPTSLRDQSNADGSLRFDGGNIAVHLFRMESLRKLEDKPLPWHVAQKKVGSCPNAFKFEQFLFDAFPVLGSMLALGVDREEDFAPVKNAEGNDSPATARRLIGKLHRRWLMESGCKLSMDHFYEISPLLSFGGEDLNPTLFANELGKSILEFPARD